MAVITPTQVDAAGEEITFVAASGGGDSIANAQGATFVVNNASGSSITVTFTGSVACSQGSTHNVTRTVAAGKICHLPVPSQAVDPTTGQAAVGYSAVTSVTVAAYKH